MRGMGLFMMLALMGTSVMAVGAQDSEIRPPSDRWENEEYWKDVRPGRVFICYDTGIDVYTATQEELGIADKRVSLMQKLNSRLNTILVSVPENVEGTKEFIRLVEKKSRVRWAEPDRWMHLVFTPNDSCYSADQYDKRQMNCEAAWDIGLGSMDITAAVIDQGSQYTHEDLTARYVGYVGYDYLDSDDDPTALNINEDHGTHCSGILAATTDNVMGIAGVANVRLLSYRCGDDVELDASACVNAIEESADSGWNILSLSWGSTDYMATVAAAVNDAWNAGCLMFAATGNSGCSYMLYPARDPKVIAVGAINSGDRRPGFSNYGSEMELAAGGVKIVSTVPFDEYAFIDGTSMACPNAAGAGALVWSAKPSATNSEIRAVLCSTAVDLGSITGWDQHYGHGKPDCFAAIELLLSDTSGVEEISVDAALEFNALPNPFRKRIDISYEITRGTHVKLVFSDIAGREVVTLVDGFQNPGLKEASWRTGDTRAGVYFCRFVSSDLNVTRKVLLVK
jgi:subtilisin family serine protease